MPTLFPLQSKESIHEYIQDIGKMRNFTGPEDNSKHEEKQNLWKEVDNSFTNKTKISPVDSYISLHQEYKENENLDYLVENCDQILITQGLEKPKSFSSTTEEKYELDHLVLGIQNHLTPRLENLPQKHPQHSLEYKDNIDTSFTISQKLMELKLEKPGQNCVSVMTDAFQEAKDILQAKQLPAVTSSHDIKTAHNANCSIAREHICVKRRTGNDPVSLENSERDCKENSQVNNKGQDHTQFCNSQLNSDVHLNIDCREQRENDKENQNEAEVEDIALSTENNIRNIHGDEKQSFHANKNFTTVDERRENEDYNSIEILSSEEFSTTFNLTWGKKYVSTESTLLENEDIVTAIKEEDIQNTGRTVEHLVSTTVPKIAGSSGHTASHAAVQIADAPVPALGTNLEDHLRYQFKETCSSESPDFGLLVKYRASDCETDRDKNQLHNSFHQSVSDNSVLQSVKLDNEIEVGSERSDNAFLFQQDAHSHGNVLYEDFGASYEALKSRIDWEGLLGSTNGETEVLKSTTRRENSDQHCSEESSFYFSTAKNKAELFNPILLPDLEVRITNVFMQGFSPAVEPLALKDNFCKYRTEAIKSEIKDEEEEVPRFEIHSQCSGENSHHPSEDCPDEKLTKKENQIDAEFLSNVSKYEKLKNHSAHGDIKGTTKENNSAEANEVISKRNSVSLTCIKESNVNFNVDKNYDATCIAHTKVKTDIVISVLESSVTHVFNIDIDKPNNLILSGYTRNLEVNFPIEKWTPPNESSKPGIITENFLMDPLNLTLIKSKKCNSIPQLLSATLVTDSEGESSQSYLNKQSIFAVDSSTVSTIVPHCQRGCAGKELLKTEHCASSNCFHIDGNGTNVIENSELDFTSVTEESKDNMMKKLFSNDSFLLLKDNIKGSSSPKCIAKKDIRDRKTWKDKQAEKAKDSFHRNVTEGSSVKTEYKNQKNKTLEESSYLSEKTVKNNLIDSHLSIKDATEAVSLSNTASNQLNEREKEEGRVSHDSQSDSTMHSGRASNSKPGITGMNHTPLLHAHSETSSVSPPPKMPTSYMNELKEEHCSTNTLAPIAKIAQILKRADEASSLQILQEETKVCQSILPLFVEAFERKQECSFKQILISRDLLVDQNLWNNCRHKLKPCAVDSLVELQMMMETIQFIENKTRLLGDICCISEILDQAEFADFKKLQELTLRCTDHLEILKEYFQLLQEDNIDNIFITQENVLDMVKNHNHGAVILKPAAIETYIEIVMLSETVHFLKNSMAKKLDKQRFRGMLWFDLSLLPELVQCQEKMTSFSFLKDDSTDCLWKVIETAISELKKDLDIIYKYNEAVNCSYALHLLSRELEELSEIKKLLKKSKYSISTYIDFVPCIASINYGSTVTELEYNYNQFSTLLKNVMAVPRKDLGKMAHITKVMKTIEHMKIICAKDAKLTISFILCQMRHNRKKTFHLERKEEMNIHVEPRKNINKSSTCVKVPSISECIMKNVSNSSKKRPFTVDKCEDPQEQEEYTTVSSCKKQKVTNVLSETYVGILFENKSTL
ncbi:hypothetical protein J1605_010209 [Eschrichtius robustus]|uniref:Testis expressed sequence 15 domain-containing protein n=1 Tax=Eschrichtius robustus TaxID=9764 RepID=A0AB34GUD0_ESCRO|nr:hypothetical protein J1605_010209 [Eschrichtius robustus]